ncbi:hypothetical protein Voja6_00106 [Pseudomonas phage vB_PpuM-Voja-6]
MLHINVVTSAVIQCLHALPTPRLNVNTAPYMAQPDTLVIDMGLDSLDWVEFAMALEDYEGIACDVPDKLVSELVKQSEAQYLTVQQFCELLAANL